MEYTLYILADPRTLKIKYIGLTRTPLKQRLSTHISKAKNNYFNYKKDVWIRSLLLHNCKPIIRKIGTTSNLQEGRQLERKLITKYRNRLLNINETGVNGKNTIVTQERKKAISNTLKKRYSEGLENISRKEVHVYNLSGRYLYTFKSNMIAAQTLNISYSALYKCISGIAIQYAGYQFNYKKVDRMTSLSKTPKIIKDMAVQDFCRFR